VTDGEIAALWSAWQQRLRLGDHDITLNFEDEGDECFAWAKPSRNYDRGEVIFYRSMLAKLSERDVEATIVHELLHFKHKEVEDVFDLVEAQVHRDAWAVFDKASDDACERFIDRMAYVLLDLVGA
jgi:hypothetical protein